MYRIYFTDDGTVLRHENVCGFGTGKGHMHLSLLIFTAA